MSFDLDALARDGQPFPFTFGGEDYTLPADPPLVASGLLRDGDDVAAMRALLGDEQWARIEGSSTVLGVAATRALLRAYNEHLGVPQGGSSASTAT